MDSFAKILILCVIMLFLYTIYIEYNDDKIVEHKCNTIQGICQGMEPEKKQKLNEIESAVILINEKKNPHKFKNTVKTCTSNFCKGFITGFITGGPQSGIIIGGMSAMLGPVFTNLEKTF